MNTNRGKSYFYAMGARDAYLFTIPVTKKFWPSWAIKAYMNGFDGWGL